MHIDAAVKGRELAAEHDVDQTLARHHPPSFAQQNVQQIELDPATRSVSRDGQPVELTSVEFNLLEVLLREAGRVVPRERLVNAVLSRKFSPFDRSIDMHVSKVRKKLGDSDTGSDHIKTVRGVGYIFAHPRDHATGELATARGEET